MVNMKKDVELMKKKNMLKDQSNKTTLAWKCQLDVVVISGNN